MSVTTCGCACCHGTHQPRRQHHLHHPFLSEPQIARLLALLHTPARINSAGPEACVFTSSLQFPHGALQNSLKKKKKDFIYHTFNNDPSIPVRSTLRPTCLQNTKCTSPLIVPSLDTRPDTGPKYQPHATTKSFFAPSFLNYLELKLPPVCRDYALKTLCTSASEANGNFFRIHSPCFYSDILSL